MEPMLVILRPKIESSPEILPMFCKDACRVNCHVASVFENQNWEFFSVDKDGCMFLLKREVACSSFGKCFGDPFCVKCSFKARN